MLKGHCLYICGSKSAKSTASKCHLFWVDSWVCFLKWVFEPVLSSGLYSHQHDVLGYREATDKFGGTGEWKKATGVENQHISHAYDI